MTGIVEVYLHPGEVVASSERCVITTILGSCVSICLAEPGTTLGGANHYLLPEQRSSDAQSTRYAHGATEALINWLVDLGARRSRLNAWLFGGANVLRAFQDNAAHIGAANVAIARTLLAKHNIPICAEDVGGTRGRRLVFSAYEGTASVQRLRP